MRAPLKSGIWTRMPADTLMGLHEDVGTITVGEDEWVMSRSVTSLHVYLSTTIPHPDDTNQTARYVANVADLYTELMADLTAVEKRKDS